jgi:diacylglycerol kinase (ATP)
MATPSLVIIGNPAAGRGTARRRAAALATSLARHGLTVDGVVRWTTRQGDEARLTQQAIDEGATLIGALGGDGTISQVGGTIAVAGANAVLLPLPAGTGNDFVKSLAVPAHDHAAMLALAIDGSHRLIDVGQVDGVPFLNAAGFGFDADVVAATREVRWLSGAALYAGTALRRLLGFRGVMAALNGTAPRRRVLAAFANGRVFGGAFHIAPDAELDDGALDAVLVDDASLVRRVSLLMSVARGTHGTRAEVHSTRAAQFVLHLDGPAEYQADGELRRTRTGIVSIDTMPAALRVVARR